MFRTASSLAPMYFDNSSGPCKISLEHHRTFRDPTKLSVEKIDFFCCILSKFEVFRMISGRPENKQLYHSR